MNSTLVRELADQVREEFADRFVVEAVLDASAASCHLVVREPEVAGRRLILHALARTALRGRGLDASLGGTLARWREFQHPGATRLESAGESDRLRWAAVAHPQGPTLADHLRERGAFDRPAALRVVESLAEVLAAAHTQGLTHGDVRAAHVILTPQARPRLGAFGVGAAVEALAGMPVPEATPAGDQGRLARLYVACRLGMPNVVDDDVETPNDARFSPAEREAITRAQGRAHGRPFASIGEFVAALREPPRAAPRQVPSPVQQPLLFVDAPARTNRAWRVGFVVCLVLLGAMPAQRLWNAEVSLPGVPPIRPAAATAPTVVRPEARSEVQRVAPPRVPPPTQPKVAAPAPKVSQPVAAVSTPRRIPPQSRSAPPASEQESVVPVSSSPVVEPQPPGELGVSTRPWGHLYVDGRYIGDTPVASLPIEPGPHTVRIVRPGYRPVERSLVVRSGERVRLTDVQLVRVAP